MVKVHKARVENGEIVEGTIFNYYKAGRRFCDANDIKLEDWSAVSNKVPTGRKHSDDRAPNDEEIKQIVTYPDRRIKGIIYTMLSSGIRRSSWAYMKWKHIDPYKDENGKVLCAKLTAYNIKRKGKQDKWYYTFITPEAYNALLEYKTFREKQGEKVDGDSWVMVHKDDPSKPLSPLGVKIIIERAAQKAKLFAPLKKNQKRREWQLTHGFRKAFKTRASEVMDHLIVEMCLDHDTGLAESYYKAQESTRRANYLKAVPLLMIEDANKNIDKITAEVTMKVTAGLNEQIRDLTNKYALTNFKREIDNIVANSKALALERIAEKGGELKKFEWSKEEQLEHFIKQQRKMDEELTEDQINYIKSYLAKSDPIEIYERIPTAAQSKAATQEDIRQSNQYYNSLSQDELEKLRKQWIEENKIDEGKSEEEIQKEEQEIIKLQEKLTKRYIIKDVERKEFTDKAKRKE